MEVRKVKCMHCSEVFYIDKAGDHTCPPPPKRHCSLCGIDEEDTDYGMLVDFTVVCANGEEGYSNITQLVCDDNGCLSVMQKALMTIGFRNHEHGGTCFLQDESCPGGWQNCPTPTEYGNVIVDHNWPEYNDDAASM